MNKLMNLFIPNVKIHDKKSCIPPLPPILIKFFSSCEEESVVT